MLCSVALWMPYVVTSLVLIHLIDVALNRGFVKLLKTIANFLLLLPGSESLVKVFTKKEVKGFLTQNFSDYNEDKSKVVSIPPKAIPIEELKQQLESFKKGDEQLSENGKLFAYVYTNEGPRFELQKEAFRMFTEITSGDMKPEHEDIVKAYLENFMHDNALNPIVFPNLRKFENEVVAMTAHMLNGNSQVAGNVTSGGTESILMAMKTYREQARYLSPKITNPNVVAPMTIHPAFEKAACYFNLTIKHVPVDPKTFTVHLKDYENAIDKNTILLLASAPSYPQGIMDQVEEISQLAEKHRLPLHVDACFGGFMLPWVERLGKNKIKKWDFRLPGVMSISADLHKYGFATKGASVVCYRNSDIRKHQFYCYSGWSGGLYVSPTMAGSRPGGHLAAAWVALRSMGQDGYMDMAAKLMETTEKMMEKINNIDGLCTLGNPLISAFAFATTEKSMSIFSVVDVMEKKGTFLVAFEKVVL